MYSSGNTFLNAVVGAVASLVLVFLPFSPAVGGAAAGYLQRGTTGDGAKAGAVSGLLVAFPLFLIVVLLAPVFLFAPAGVPSIPTSAVGFVLLATLGTLAYALGTATIGGAVGAYLAAVRHHAPANDRSDATGATGATAATAATATANTDEGPEDHTTAGDD